MSIFINGVRNTIVSMLEANMLIDYKYLGKINVKLRNTTN